MVICDWERGRDWGELDCSVVFCTALTAAHGGVERINTMAQKYPRSTKTSSTGKGKEGNRPAKKGSTGCLRITTNCLKGKNKKKELT
jgi:hypothetical protein